MEKKELITREIENVRKKISKTVTGLNVTKVLPRAGSATESKKKLRY